MMNRRFNPRLSGLLSVLGGLASATLLWSTLTPRPARLIPIDTAEISPLRFFESSLLTDPGRLTSKWITLTSKPPTRQHNHVEASTGPESLRIIFLDTEAEKTTAPVNFPLGTLSPDTQAGTTTSAVRLPIGFDNTGRFYVEFHSEKPKSHRPSGYRSRVPEHIEWFDPETSQAGIIPVPNLIGNTNDWETISYWMSFDRTKVAQLRYNESGPSELFVADLTTGVTRSKCQPELKPAGWPGLSKLYVSPDLTRLFVPAKVETDLVGPDFEHWEETIVEVTEYDMATGEVLDSISAIAFQSRLENQVESAFPKRREEWVKGLKIDDFAPFREEKSSESVGGLTTQSDTAYLLVNPSGPNTHIEVWNSPPRRPLVTISLLTLAITAGTWFWLTSRRREVSVDPK